MTQRTTVIIQVSKYNIKRINRTPCYKCNQPFQLKEKIVSVRKIHNMHGKIDPKHYHINHYTDAHGVPIYE